MFVTKSYKFLLIAIFSLGLTSQPVAKAAQLTAEKRFLISAMVGAAHGLVNNMHFEAIKANPEQYSLFYLFTYVLAHGVQRSILGKKPYQNSDTFYTHNDFMSLFSHGLAQSLVESYDAEKIAFSNLSLNWTLVESFFAA